MEQTPGVPDHAAPQTYETVDPSTIEPQVKFGTAGAGVGAALSAFSIWAVDKSWYGGEMLAPEVPLPVAGLINVVVTAGSAFLGGWLGRHVNR